MPREKGTFTRAAFTEASETHIPKSGPSTARAEQMARETGKLDPLVDPAGYGVIRRSLPRFVQLEDKFWELTNGTPMPIETRIDTTGSMGGNVDIALRVLPNLFEHCGSVLPGYDLQVATGIFGDVGDNFVLCRPQFEMEAEKIVKQLTLMVPERAGGDNPEDPHYGLFGSAYLTAAYINRIGLKGYDFTISDAPARDRLDQRTLRRIFGDEVFTMVAENGHKIDVNDLPTTDEVVKDLLKRAHAFFLQVGESNETTFFWTKVFGSKRVIILPKTELAPQVQAVIIGLTEGTLDLKKVPKFLEESNVGTSYIDSIVRSVANIPIGAQAALPNFAKRPVKGDLFREKTDMWPVDKAKVAKAPPKPGKKSGKPGGSSWL